MRATRLSSHPTRIRAFVDDILATLNRRPACRPRNAPEARGTHPAAEGYVWASELVTEEEAICPDPENRRSAEVPEQQTP